MNQTVIIAVVAVAVLVALFLLLRPKPAAPRIDTPATPVVEGDGILDSASAAAQDVVGPLIGVDVHPDAPADDLTVLKGLGPKAAGQLNALGITRLDQLAALDADAIAALDARMGAFAGRILRDRWVEQAGYLARGDKAGFEAAFGKLGG